jgi:hypothetical protein
VHQCHSLIYVFDIDLSIAIILNVFYHFQQAQVILGSYQYLSRIFVGIHQAAVGIGHLLP